MSMARHPAYAAVADAAAVTDTRGRPVLTVGDQDLLVDWINHPGRHVFALRYLTAHVDELLRCLDEPAGPLGDVVARLRRATVVAHELGRR